MLKQRNSKIQANVGIGLAIAHFTLKGNVVCIPLTDSQCYDLVVDIDGLKKIQIKTTRAKNPFGNYVVELRTKTHCGSKIYLYKGLEENLDFIFILTEEGKKYLIPRDKIKPKRILTLTKKFDSFLV